MARDLTVDTDGLQVAAAGSAQAAIEVLNGGTVGATAGTRPSEAGVAAVDAAAAALRVRQARRIVGQAEPIPGHLGGGHRLDMQLLYEEVVAALRETIDDLAFCTGSKSS